MADPITARTLNRTTLQRQLLLERAPLDALSAVRQLVGLQAQVPANPYPGLWSRLEGFDATDLGTLSSSGRSSGSPRSAARSISFTADDCLAFWPLFRPVFDRELAAHPEVGPALAGVDLDPILGWARTLLSKEPLSLPAFRTALGERFPAHDAAALAYACRNHLALVQVPPRGLFGAQSGHGDDGRGVARASARCLSRRSTTSSSATCAHSGRQLRRMWRHGLGSPASPPSSTASVRSSGNGGMMQGEPCGMSRTASWPTRRRPRRCGPARVRQRAPRPCRPLPLLRRRSPPPPSTRRPARARSRAGGRHPAGIVADRRRPRRPVAPPASLADEMPSSRRRPVLRRSYNPTIPRR